MRIQCSTEHGRPLERQGTSPICKVGQSSKSVPKIKHKALKIGTRNFQGVCSDRKALEIGEVLSKNHINIIHM